MNKKAAIKVIISFMILAVIITPLYLLRNHIYIEINPIEEQIKYFNFPKLFKDGYILLHYTLQGRFYFYHPEKKEYKNISFIPADRRYLNSKMKYHDNYTDVRIYTDTSTVMLSMMRYRGKYTVTKYGTRKGYSDDYGGNIELYVIDKNNSISTIKNYGRENVGFIKHGTKYYTEATNKVDYKNYFISITKDGEKEYLYEVPMIDQHLDKFKPWELFQFDEHNIFKYSHYDNQLFSFEEVENRFIAINEPIIKYNDIIFYNNKIQNKYNVVNNNGSIIVQGRLIPEESNNDESFVFVGYLLAKTDLTYEKYFLGSLFSTNIIFAPDRTCFSFITEVEYNELAPKYESECSKIKKALLYYPINVSIITYNIKEESLLEHNIVMPFVSTFDDYKDYRKGDYSFWEGFETIRGKVVNGKFVKIKRCK